MQNNNLPIRLLGEIPIIWKTRLASGVLSGNGAFIPTEGSQIVAGRFAYIGLKDTNQNERVAISGSIASSGFSVENLQRNRSSGEPVWISDFNLFALYSGESDNGTFVEVGSGEIKGLNSPDFHLISGVNVDTSKYYKVAFGNSDGYESLTNRDAFRLDSVGNVINSYCTIDDVLIEAGMYSQDYAVENQKKIQDYIDAGKSLIHASFRTQGIATPLTGENKTLAKTINVLYAAGMLLSKEFGIMNEGSSRDGLTKIELAKRMLEDVRSGLVPDGTSEPSGGSSGMIQFSPDESVNSDFTRDRIY